MMNSACRMLSKIPETNIFCTLVFCLHKNAIYSVTTEVRPLCLNDLDKSGSNRGGNALMILTPLKREVMGQKGNVMLSLHFRFPSRAKAGSRDGGSFWWSGVEVFIISTDFCYSCPVLSFVNQSWSLKQLLCLQPTKCGVLCQGSGEP